MFYTRSMVIHMFSLEGNEKNKKNEKNGKKINFIKIDPISSDHVKM